MWEFNGDIEWSIDQTGRFLPDPVPDFDDSPPRYWETQHAGSYRGSREGNILRLVLTRGEDMPAQRRVAIGCR